MARNKRVQRKVSSNVSPTPNVGADEASRDTRTSSIFPYSVARPPTDFAPHIPDSAMTASSPPIRERGSPPAIRVDQQVDPFADDETVMDHRETPLYARSDWDPTTGVKTAWTRSSFPDYADEVGDGDGEGQGRTGMLGDEMNTGGPLTTVWSRSSYASDTSAPPPLRVTEPLALKKPRVPEGGPSTGTGHTMVDPYIAEPGTAWSQTSVQPIHPRASQIGTVIQARTIASQPSQPLPLPSHMVPLTGEDHASQPSQSRQLVSNGNYGTALKSAGSRKPSQLVDITEMSETSHRSQDRHDTNNHHDDDYQSRGSAGYGPMTGNSIRLRASKEDGMENPFSPMFAGPTFQSPNGEARSPPFPDQYSHSHSHSELKVKMQHKHNRSTLPSILDLEDLAARPRHAQLPRPHSAHAGPGPRPGSGGGGGGGQRTGYSVDSPQLQPPRMMGRVGTDSPRLLRPEAQNRLGRMSVATARYSLPPNRRNATHPTGVNPSRGSNQNSTSEKTKTHSSASRSGSGSAAVRSFKRPVGWWKNLKKTGLVKWYRTWRPFITALHTLMAALLLTTAMADESSGLGWLIKIQAGGLATMPATGGFGLGINGWCQLDEDAVCSSYSKKDFANTEESFTVPENSTHQLLYPLWVALTTMTWFQALLALSASFLHFYLFYILHIPFSHLADVHHSHRHRLEQSSSTDGGGDDDEDEDDDQVQKEVDIRARCERPPFEEYIWVWWAWWAFRRSPVAHIYALIVGSLSLVMGGLGLKFRNDASSAAMPGSVTFGFGGFLPFIVLLMTLDSFICAIRCYVFSPICSFKLFTDPPEPTPAAILLPPSEKPLALRHRGTRASTFFAAPTTARFSRGQTFHPIANRDPPPLPLSDGDPPSGGGTVDEETERWLAEYPHDPELLPLMTDLARGGGNDEFVLSDVGLLYLRPDESDSSGAALLVPPQGVIRREILGDSHVEIENQQRHRGYEEMLDELEKVFWWAGMEQDIESYLAQCPLCAHQHHQSERGVVGWKSEDDGSKSTYTGITGWTGEETGRADDEDGDMAVEMAVAMRKANEDAQRPWAG